MKYDEGNDDVSQSLGMCNSRKYHEEAWCFIVAKIGFTVHPSTCKPQFIGVLKPVVVDFLQTNRQLFITSLESDNSYQC